MNRVLKHYKTRRSVFAPPKSPEALECTPFGYNPGFVIPQKGSNLAICRNT